MFCLGCDDGLGAECGQLTKEIPKVKTQIQNQRAELKQSSHVSLFKEQKKKKKFKGWCYDFTASIFSGNSPMR